METTENLLSEWMALTKHKNMPEESATYYKKFADTSILTAIDMGSTDSIMNIVLGAIDPFSFVFVNVAQSALGCTGLIATVIITASKQLEFEKNTLHHIEHASKYGELHRTIQAELILFHMKDSSYASKTLF
jgi:hypothetical protein